MYFFYGTYLKSEGIIKAILENPKGDRNTPFCKSVIFTTTCGVLFDLYLQPLHTLCIKRLQWLMVA